MKPTVLITALILGLGLLFSSCASLMKTEIVPVPIQRGRVLVGSVKDDTTAVQMPDQGRLFIIKKMGLFNTETSLVYLRANGTFETYSTDGSQITHREGKDEVYTHQSSTGRYGYGYGYYGHTYPGHYPGGVSTYDPFYDRW